MDSHSQRTCPVPGCEHKHKRDLLMCPGHWGQVSQSLRTELWDAYKSDGIFTDRYMDARSACIESVTLGAAA